MENQENKTLSGEVDNNEIDTSQDYIATIAELKRNSVSKSEYEKLRQENRNLLQTLSEGGSIEVVQEKPPVDIEGLRRELFNQDGNLSNLEYITKTLELRDALIERGDPDPFLPVSSKTAPTDEERLQAEKVAMAFRECVDYADGDSQIFTQELMRITSDVNRMPQRSTPRRR